MLGLALTVRAATTTYNFGGGVTLIITPISDYPNTNALGSNTLFLITVPGIGTNLNISWGQITNLIAGLGFVTNGVSGTNGASGTNGVNGAAGPSGTNNLSFTTLGVQSNSWTLDNEAVVLIMTGPGAVTNITSVTGTNYGHLWVSNSTASTNNFSITAPCRIQGFNTSNVISVPPGKMYLLSAELFTGRFTNLVWITGN